MRLIAVCRAAAAVVLAIGACWGAWSAWALQERLGAQRQQIKVRWVPQTTADARLQAERDLSLANGQVREGHTWSYVLRNYSRENVERLVSHPLVDDTDGVDRANFRVPIDAPDVPAWLRRLAEGRWLPAIALIVAAGGLVPLVAWRRDVASVPRVLVTAPVGTLAIDRAIPRLAGLAAAAILILGAPTRPEDSSFVHLYEAVSILHGDHPYRDFFEWGGPLAAYLSAGVQWLVGYRVIGELVLQWTFIVAGVVIAAHLGLSLSRSRVASLAVAPATVLLLGATPSYHYSKLLCFPLAIWLAWRYMDRPGPRASVILGVTTALAFLLRHDYGIWVGLASALAMVIARVTSPVSSRPRTASDLAWYAAAVAIMLLPWAAVVQLSEGLVPYVHARAAMYESAPNSLRSLFQIHPIRDLSPAQLPPPKRGVVEFSWRADIDDARQQRLEREHGLESRQAVGQHVRYEVANLYDLRLIALRSLVNDDQGFDWNVLIDVQGNRPSLLSVNLWMSQMAILAAAFLAVSGATALWKGWRRAPPLIEDGRRMLLAGVVLFVIDAALFRQPSYVVTVAPVTAALSARFLAWHGGRPLVAAVRSAFVLLLLVATTYAEWIDVGGAALFDQPWSDAVARSKNAFGQLAASPPDGGNATYTYLRTCTSPGDRLLVAGLTPFHFNYYSGRPMAGGHLYWHSRWRSDPAREAESLALLERQSVPFAVSLSDPVLADFDGRYPRIHQYLTQHYTELPGSGGHILVDSRRPRVGDYGAEGWPCFRPAEPASASALR